MLALLLPEQTLNQRKAPCLFRVSARYVISWSGGQLYQLSHQWQSFADVFVSTSWPEQVPLVAGPSKAVLHCLWLQSPLEHWGSSGNSQAERQRRTLHDVE